MGGTLARKITEAAHIFAFSEVTITFAHVRIGQTLSRVLQVIPTDIIELNISIL